MMEKAIVLHLAQEIYCDKWHKKQIIGVAAVRSNVYEIPNLGFGGKILVRKCEIPVSPLNPKQ